MIGAKSGLNVRSRYLCPNVPLFSNFLYLAQLVSCFSSLLV